MRKILGVGYLSSRAKHAGVPHSLLNQTSYCPMRVSIGNPTEYLTTIQNGDDDQVERLPLENKSSTSALNFSMLDRLEAYRQPVDGKLELQMRWPDTDLRAQHWKQKSNPYVHSGAVTGYEAISCPHSDHAWGGLQSGHPHAVLNGSTNDDWWHYAIGSYLDWNGGIPGPIDAVQRVELWARRSTEDQWVLIMRQTAPQPYWTKEAEAERVAKIDGELREVIAHHAWHHIFD